MTSLVISIYGNRNYTLVDMQGVVKGQCRIDDSESWHFVQFPQPTPITAGSVIRMYCHELGSCPWPSVPCILEGGMIAQQFVYCDQQHSAVSA